jgi:hypothetical protein
MTIEQMFLMQTQVVKAIGQTLAAMQQVQQQEPPPQPQMQVQMPQMPRDKHAEFMRGHPPVFSHYSDLKRPDPLGLKCDTITSPRRLVTTFITSNSYRV